MHKYQPLLVLSAVIIGLLFGGSKVLGETLGYFIIPALILLLVSTFLPLEFKAMRKHMNRHLVIASLLINFVMTPIVAFSLGYIFLSGHPMLWIGLVMLLVTPCTDWYLVFIALAKGNSMLGITLLPLNLILQVLLLPLYLYLFFGTYEFVDFNILISALFIVGIPVAASAVLSLFLHKRQRDLAAHAQLPLLSIAVMSMFAANQSIVMEHLNTLVILFIPLLLFFIITWLTATLTSRQLGFNYADSVTLTMTTLARNSPIALAIALFAFPDQPLIAVALILGSLIELPLLTIISYLFSRFKSKYIQIIKN